jgi:hypothetical protein
MTLAVRWEKLPGDVEVPGEHERFGTATAYALIDQRGEVGEHAMHGGDRVLHPVGLTVDLLGVLLAAVKGNELERLTIDCDLSSDDAARMRVVLERDRPQRAVASGHRRASPISVKLGPQDGMGSVRWWCALLKECHIPLDVLSESASEVAPRVSS